MGFFRGGALFFVGVLLFFSLLAMNSFFTLATSLKYENVQQEATPLVAELFEGLNEENRTLFNETVAQEFLQDVYYKDYGCGFWKCFIQEEIPFFLVSEQARDYWKGKLYLALIVSLVLSAIAFFLVENKKNWPVVVGGILILSAIPLLKIKQFVAFFIPDSLTSLSIFLNIFFSKAYM